MVGVVFAVCALVAFVAFVMMRPLPGPMARVH
jgi:hypothetical protein